MGHTQDRWVYVGSTTEADYYYDITTDLGSMTVDGYDVDSDYSRNLVSSYYYDMSADLSEVEITYQWPSGN